MVLKLNLLDTTPLNFAIATHVKIRFIQNLIKSEYLQNFLQLKFHAPRIRFTKMINLFKKSEWFSKYVSYY